jgi:putative flippase GtrA
MSGKPGSGVAMRWLKFNGVGAAGIGLQLVLLAALKTLFHLPYLKATAVAVEFTVLHNYVWHEKFTWADRPRKNRFGRALKFNLSNGLISMAGNIALMKLLVGSMHMRYLGANGVAIAVCSLANFLVSDRLVFRTEQADAHPKLGPGKFVPPGEADSPAD